MSFTKRPNILYQDKLLDGATTSAAVAATTVLPICTMDGDYRVEKFEVMASAGYTSDATNYYDISLQVAPKALTAVAATDIITVTAHGLHTGDAVQFTTSSALPGGITLGVVYYAIVLTVDTFKISDTNAHALAGTNVVDITSTGTTSFAARVLAVWSCLTGSDGTLTAVTFANGRLLGTPTGLKGDQLNAVLTKQSAGANFPIGSVFNAHLKQLSAS